MRDPRTGRRARPKRRNKDYVVVTNRSYGAALRGTRIYFEGRRPPALKDDGSITLGKHILEALRVRFGKFRWTITLNTDSISVERGITRVRTSLGLLRRMSKENWERGRDIKNDIVRRFFAGSFPDHFHTPTTLTYVPGTLAQMLAPAIVPRLSTEDKDAINAFLPNYAAVEAVGAVEQLKAATQIKTLKALATNLEAEMARSHPESWWQTYVKSNVLLMQQGYIKAIEKLNVAIGDIRFPDFCLVTHDNYLDILEIKRPDTELLRHDASRGNYYWATEMAKAISQTENYIDQVSSKAADVRSYLLDKEKIDVKAVRPRGIILAGNTNAFENAKQRNDLRILSQTQKNITVLTYDELLTRLTNYIAVLTEFSGQKTRRRTKSS